MFIQGVGLLNRHISAAEAYDLYYAAVGKKNTLLDSLVLNEEKSYAFSAPSLLDNLTIRDSIFISQTHNVFIKDIYKLAEAMYVVQEESVLENYILSETQLGYVTRINHLLDIFVLPHAINSHLSAYELLISALALQDYISAAVYKSLEDVVLYTEAFSNHVEFHSKLIDEILFAGSVRNNYTLTLLITDSIKCSEYTNTAAQIHALMEENFIFFSGVKFDADDEYIVYTLNTQSKGISEYTNYGFNSFSYPLAASNEGIYQLDSSDTDDGKNIEASIKTGIYDFGTSLKKQVPYAYLGITDRGRVLLKTVTNNFGIKKERWYEVNSYNDVVDTTRVQMGKGVKAKYWQFELSNIEGETFSLESMEVLPLVLQRRKQ